MEVAGVVSSHYHPQVVMKLSLMVVLVLDLLVLNQQEETLISPVVAQEVLMRKEMEEQRAGV